MNEKGHRVHSKSTLWQVPTCMYSCREDRDVFCPLQSEQRADIALFKVLLILCYVLLEDSYRSWALLNNLIIDYNYKQVQIVHRSEAIITWVTASYTATAIMLEAFSKYSDLIKAFDVFDFLNSSFCFYNILLCNHFTFPIVFFGWFSINFSVLFLSCV